MADHNYENVPVHVRTVHDEDSGMSFVQACYEIDGVLHPFHIRHLEAFETVHDHLKNGVPETEAE